MKKVKLSGFPFYRHVTQPEFPASQDHNQYKNNPYDKDVPEIINKLRDQAVKVTTHFNKFEDIGSHPFQGKPEINGIDEIRHQSKRVRQVKPRISKSLGAFPVPEFERDRIEENKRKIQQQHR